MSLRFSPARFTGRGFFGSTVVTTPSPHQNPAAGVSSSAHGGGFEHEWLGASRRWDGAFQANGRPTHDAPDVVFPHSKQG